MKLILCQVLYLCILLCFTTCQKKTSSSKVAFYHWRSQLNLDDSTQNYLRNLSVKELYLRVFDVDYDAKKSESKLVGKVGLPQKLGLNLSLIPTIFITNRCMLQQKTTKQQQALAEMIYEQILQSLNQNLQKKVKEVQIDCDWTPKSQANFFAFLKVLKKKLKKNLDWKLSATIRLHQYRYPDQTGVPPTDRAVLMFYNMGALDGSNTKNSILDLSIAEEYLMGSKPYPLPLDVAMPLFSWLVWQRYGKVLNLISQFPEDALSQGDRYQLQEGNTYLVKKSHYLGGEYVYKGDALRLENISLEDLTQSLRLLQKYLPRDSQRQIIFYHLSPEIRRNYSVEDLKGIL